ncbi:hypothetical protein D3093_29810 (plasmid) [Azospirillum argentinense]|uniref:Uncharacterized protein n=1 Tax=Azospirillum argentinense TaxID=2970906 RepID=A0A4D8PMR2_9PROT|nr:hypothetical protein D3093_29810 [Azospirillum argentinense]
MRKPREDAAKRTPDYSGPHPAVEPSVKPASFNPLSRPGRGKGPTRKRGKGEDAAENRPLDPWTTLTRRLWRHPLPGREREL